MPVLDLASSGISWQVALRPKPVPQCMFYCRWNQSKKASVRGAELTAKLPGFCNRGAGECPVSSAGFSPDTSGKAAAHASSAGPLPPPGAPA